VEALAREREELVAARQQSQQQRERMDAEAAAAAAERAMAVEAAKALAAERARVDSAARLLEEERLALRHDIAAAEAAAAAREGTLQASWETRLKEAEATEGSLVVVSARPVSVCAPSGRDLG